VTVLFKNTSPRCWKSGYVWMAIGRTYTKNVCPGDLTVEYHRLLDLLLKVFNERLFMRRMAQLSGAGSLDAIADCRGWLFPVSRRIRSATALELAPTNRPTRIQAGTGTIRKGMVLAIEAGDLLAGRRRLAAGGQFLDQPMRESKALLVSR